MHNAQLPPPTVVAHPPPSRVYDVRSMQLVSTVETAAPVTSIEVSFDQQYVTTAEGRCVRFFDSSRMQCIKVQELPSHAESASFCGPRRQFVAAGEDMWVRLYDFDTGQVRGTSDAVARWLRWRALRHSKDWHVRNGWHASALWTMTLCHCMRAGA